MRLKVNQSQWEDLGLMDPFWAMTGTNKFGTWDVEAFLQTGEQQVNSVMQEVNCFGRPLRKEAVLDYGCGAGRLSRAFRSHFEQYLGLDISSNLVEKARSIHASLSGTTFDICASDRLDIPDERFDMVYCWAVFQHIGDRKVALQLLSELFRVLRKDGLLIVNVMHNVKLLYRLQPRRRLYALLRNAGVSSGTLYHRLKLYPQEVHFIPQHIVMSQLQTIGARVLDLRSHESPGGKHQFRDYFVTK